MVMSVVMMMPVMTFCRLQISPQITFPASHGGSNDAKKIAHKVKNTKYKEIQKKYKKLFPASHGGVQRCQVTCEQKATAHTIFTQMNKKIHLSYWGGRDFLRSMSEKGGNDFRQQFHLFIISTNAL